MKKSIVLVTVALALGSVAKAAPAPNIMELLTSGYSSQIKTIEESSTLSMAGCKLAKIRVEGQDPLTFKNRNIYIKDYRPLLSSKEDELKTILLMPPTGGENLLDRNNANHFCKRGYRVVILSHWDFQDEASLIPTMHDRGAIRTLSAVRNTLDFINPQRPHQVGILGTSVGAISAAIGMGVDLRISAGFFIVGGGGMVDIITESTEKNLTELRGKRMKENSFKSLEEYRSYLAKYIKIDPLDFASELKNRPTSFIIAQQDITVPTKNQMQLLSAAESKEVLFIDGTHFKVILKSSATQKSRIQDFFERNLH